MLVVILLLPLFVGNACTENFHFVNSNVAYGTVPTRIHITGYWYLDKQDSILQSLLRNGYTAEELKGNLFVCRRNIERKMLLINDIAKERKASTIKKMLNGTRDTSHVNQYIDATGCEEMSVYKTDADSTVYRFDIIHNFTMHNPLLFIDPWSVAAFHFRAKHSEVMRMHFCENDDLTFPVIFNKRPVCPRPSMKSTSVETGRITVYKPNIQSVQKTAYQCYIEAMLVLTFTGIFGERYNNLPLTKRLLNFPSKEFCEEMMRSKQCNASDYSHRHEWRDFNPKMTQVSKTRWATTNKIIMDYSYLTEKRYFIVNCILDIGYIRASPPFSNLQTPWTFIKPKYLHRSWYPRNGGEMIVWEAFDKTDMCTYVPISSMSSKRITYDSKDYIDHDTHSDATEIYQFVSDSEKSVYASDDTQTVEASSLNCLTLLENEKLYAVNDNLLISWIEQSNDAGAVERTFYPHYAYNELNEEVSKGESTVYTTDGGSSGEGGESEECNPMIDGHCRQAHYIRSKADSSPISNAKFLEKSQERENVSTQYIPNLNDSSVFATVAYLQHDFETYQREEIVRYAQTWCEHQQHLFDINTYLSRVSPSTIASSFLNRPTKANWIGNGAFATHYCNTIKEYVVVESLFVDNHDVDARLGGESFVELYGRHGVPVSQGMCFTQPIVVFKDDASFDEYRIGQLQPDGSVSTIQLSRLEKCKLERYFIHMIGTQVYTFQNYRLSSITSINDLYDHAMRLRETTVQLHDIENGNGTERKLIDPLLQNTQFIDAFVQYMPKSFKKTFVGFQNTELYNYRERRRVIGNLEELLIFINVLSANDKLTAALLGPTEISDETDFIDVTEGLSQAGLAFGKGAWSGIKYIATGIGDGAEYAVDKVGGTLENIVDNASSVLGDVADFFTGGFMEILIIGAAIVVVALIVYMFVKKKLLHS